ncbi:MAG: DUF445 family protein [Planctomycetota bacterium]
MPASLWTWILLPVVGGLTGWATNTIAVRMIFRPLEPRRILGIRIQGLVPRRQKELAKSIGRVVGGHLVEHKDVVRSLNKLDFEGILGAVIDKGLGRKVSELRSLPLIGGFLTEERVADIRGSLTRSILSHREAILDEVERGLEAGLDVPRLVEEKVAAFPVLRLEQMILDVARRELRAIEILGGVLGALIGLLQASALAFL